MKHLLIIMILSLGLKACRVPRTFIDPYLEESYNLCAAAIIGTVESLSDPEVEFESEIILNNAVYYKGCGPSRVRVKGYSSESQCGIPAPVSGERVIVFVCKDSVDSDAWRLHKYVAFAGQFVGEADLINELTQLSNGSNNCTSAAMIEDGVCTSRQPFFN